MPVPMLMERAYVAGGLEAMRDAVKFTVRNVRDNQSVRFYVESTRSVGTIAHAASLAMLRSSGHGLATLQDKDGCVLKASMSLAEVGVCTGSEYNLIVIVGTKA